MRTWKSYVCLFMAIRINISEDCGENILGFIERVIIKKDKKKKLRDGKKSMRITAVQENLGWSQ